MKKENQSFDHASDPLEDFFQKGLGKFDFEFQKADWENLEKKMDSATETVSGTRGINRYRYLAFLCLGVSLFFHGIWVSPQWDSQENQKQNPLKDIQVQQLDTLDTRLRDNTVQSTEGFVTDKDPILPQESPQANQEGKLQRSDQASGQNYLNAKAKTRPGQSPRRPVPTVSELEDPETPKKQSVNTPVSPSTPNHSEKQLPSGLSPLVPPLQENSKRQREEKKSVRIKQDIPSVLSPQKTEDLQIQSTDTSLLGASQTLAAIPLPPDNRLRPLRRGLNRWAIGFSYTPDISSTGLNDFVGPGNKIGAFLEYYASPRLSLTAGLAFAKKKYTAEGSEYEVSYGFWDQYTGGKVPTEIDATCDVIDIALNVRYYFINRPRSNFYLSGGLSSYILTREVYGYEFSYDKPDIATEWVVENENRNWLGVGNLSMGYEFAVHPKFSVQIEPFIKIPFGEVGFGRVNLFTTGSFLNLKYHLGRRY